MKRAEIYSTIRQISEKKSKRSNEDINRWKAVSLRLERLYKALEHVIKMDEKQSDIKNELLRYFPIGSVAYIQEYFPLLLRDLIDSGSPYSDNANDSNFINNEVELIIADKNITKGEYISHFFRANSLSNINDTMTHIIGESFFGLIGRKLNEETESTMFDNLVKLFDLRHTFCHEIASGILIDIETIRQCLYSGIQFITITESHVKELMPPSSVNTP